MFRQILKLREAKKAFRAGCFQDALRLSEDPEIAEHLKAVALRRACLDALEMKAKDHENRGDLTLAVAELKEIRAHESSPETRDRERELADRKKDRDELDGRIRSRLFRAKLDLGRGELLAARQVVEAIDPKQRNDEMRELLREIVERLESADQLLAKAKRVCASDPAEAESILIEAEKQHPKAEGLIGAFRELSHARVKHLVSAKVGDPAILSFLMEWSLFKRRHLDGIHCDLEADEKKIRAFVADRVKAHLGNSDLDHADRLLERLREAIGLDTDLEKVEVGISHLAAAKEQIAVGDFDQATIGLAEAKSRFGRRVALASELEKDLKAKRKEIDPAFAAAEDAVKRGDLADAKMRLLDVLDQLPGHRGSLRLLEIANEKLGKKAKALVEIRALIDRRRLSAAKRSAEELFADGGDTTEISMLLKEIEVLAKNTDERPEREPWSVELSAPAAPGRMDLRTPDAAGHGPLSKNWILSVEEHGEHVVFESDTVVFGNAVARSADILVLANLSSRHGTITRQTSFHGGVVFRLECLGEKEIVVNGNKIKSHDLQPGDEVRMGRDFRFRFAQPTERSKAAVLSVISGHDVAGAKNIILMPAIGRAGCIRIGPFDDAHVATFGADGDVEIFRDSGESGADLIIVSTVGVAVDGDEVRAKAVAYDESRVTCGELTFHVRNLPKSN
ncbi:MAG: hypothetical protein ACI97A_000294 [Planctomycetota bacterium]|jgi:hypothetical protein